MARTSDTEWDLIVVGAGSAGATLASRAAAAGRDVLLLEAGPDMRSAELPEIWRGPNPMLAILDRDAAAPFIWRDVVARRTEQQTAALYWRGRGLGGCSVVNGQIAIRPPVDDFDEWAAGGCTGWSWDDVLPFFRALEADRQFGSQPYHGDSGPTPVTRMPRSAWGSVDTALAGAASAAGFVWAPDVNAPGATGVSPYPINSRHGRRVTTNDAYLEWARDLDTLTIKGNSLVDSVVFAGNRARGVELADGQRYFANEVVLSAGVVHSPAILMRSGVGPARSLQALDIPVLADLPVGCHWQDHPLITVQLPLQDDYAAAVTDRHTNCCVRYSSGMDLHDNDMMVVSLNQDILAMEYADARVGAGALGVWLNQTYSRGILELNSRDPRQQPTVRERMLSDPRDIARMRAGVRLVAELAGSDDVAKICAVSPSEANRRLWHVLDDDAALDSFILATAADAQHGTSTCVMGAADTEDAVVDPHCRVQGVDSLRVVDASVFPSVPRANTNLAAIMLGEAIAQRMADG